MPNKTFYSRKVVWIYIFQDIHLFWLRLFLLLLILQILAGYDFLFLQEIQDEDEEFIHLFVDDLKK